MLSAKSLKAFDADFLWLLWSDMISKNVKSKERHKGGKSMSPPLVGWMMKIGIIIEIILKWIDG